MKNKRYTVPAVLLASSLAAFLLVPTSPASLVSPVHAATCPAGSVALKAGNAFVEAARNRSSAQFASALQRHTDMRRIALFALGKYRRQLGNNREREFVKLTSRYVANTLASFSKKFRASSVEVVRCRGATVESKLNQLGGRPPQKVLWKIKGSKISDVNVQNVWLAQLLRSNYTSVIQKGGGKVDVLLAQLGASRNPSSKVDHN